MSPLTHSPREQCFGSGAYSPFFGHVRKTEKKSVSFAMSRNCVIPVGCVRTWGSVGNQTQISLRCNFSDYVLRNNYMFVLSRQPEYDHHGPKHVVVSQYIITKITTHGTHQHEVITSRSRQLLMIGSWLPETCWATIRREIKNKKVTSSWFFLSTLNYDARSTTHHIKELIWWWAHGCPKHVEQLLEEK